MVCIESQQEFVSEESRCDDGDGDGDDVTADKHSIKDSLTDTSDKNNTNNNNNKEEERRGSESNAQHTQHSLDDDDDDDGEKSVAGLSEDVHQTSSPAPGGDEESDEVKREKGLDESEKVENTQHGGPTSYSSQVITVVLLFWVMVTVATSITFPGAVLPQLTQPDSDDVYLDPQTLSFFVSVANIGSVCGCLVIGQVLVPLGPRVIMLVSLPLAMASWLGLVFFSQTWVLMTCRVVSGFSFGLVRQPVVMYLVEVAHESIRGRLVCMLSIAREIGYFSSFSLNVFALTWRQLSLVYACITVPGLIGVYFLPRSPRWLVNHGRVEQARRSLVFFRGRHYDVDAELMEIVRQADEVGSSRSTCQQLKLLLRPATLKIFLLLFTIFLVLPFHGSPSTSSYLILVLNTAGSPVDPALGSVICSVFKTVGGVVHFLIVDYFDRVPIFTVGIAFVGVFNFLYSYYFHPLGKLDVETFTWVPLVSMVGVQFFSGIAAPLLDLIQGELLPNACRAVSLPILAFINGLSFFAIVQLHPFIDQEIGTHGLYGFFTAVNIFVALFFMLFIPETKGMSLEAIGDAIQKNTTNKNNKTVNAEDKDNPDISVAVSKL